MFLNILLFVVLPLLFVILIIERLYNRRLGKLPLENSMEVLTPDVTYQIVYKASIFKTLRYSIKPQEDHRTVMYYTTYYNGRADAIINVSVGNLKVYEANLKDVRHIEKE